MRKMYRYLIPVITVVYLTSGFASAVSGNALELGFVTGPTTFMDQSKFSGSSEVNVEIGLDVIYKENDTAPGLLWSGISNYWFKSNILPPMPIPSDTSPPIGFINVLLPNPFCGGPQLLNPTESLPVYWHFDINGIPPPPSPPFVYTESDTACGDCGQTGF